MILFLLVEVADHSVKVHNQDRQFLSLSIIDCFTSDHQSRRDALFILAGSHSRNIFAKCVPSLQAWTHLALDRALRL